MVTREVTGGAESAQPWQSQIMKSPGCSGLELWTGGGIPGGVLSYKAHSSSWKWGCAWPAMGMWLTGSGHLHRERGYASPGMHMFIGMWRCLIRHWNETPRQWTSSENAPSLHKVDMWETVWWMILFSIPHRMRMPMVIIPKRMVSSEFFITHVWTVFLQSMEPGAESWKSETLP